MAVKWCSGEIPLGYTTSFKRNTFSTIYIFSIFFSNEV